MSRAVVGERNARVQKRVLKVVVSAAVELVGAALRREVVNAAVTHQTVFCREIRRLQRELLNGFHRRLLFIRYLRLVSAVRLLAFENNLEIVRAAVNRDVIPAVERRARRHLDERKRIPDRSRADAEIDRQFGNLISRNRGRLLGALRLQLRRFRRHLHGLGSIADFQHDVHAGGHRDLYLNIGLLVFAKTRLLERERISSDGQSQKGIVAGSGGHGVGLCPGARIVQNQMSVRN